MAEAVIMPRQGQSVESCLITSINKKQGDIVNTGDILFSYETDKSAFDEEAKSSGTVLAVLVEEGGDVPCLEPVMIIGKEGEDISGLVPQKSVESVGATLAVARESDLPLVSVAGRPQGSPLQGATTPIAGDIKISPRAKIYAEQAKIDLSKVIPTGPGGRIIERDVIEAAENGYRLYATSDDDVIVGARIARPPETQTLAAAAEILNNIPVGADSISAHQKGSVLRADIESAPTKDLYTDVKLPNIRKIIAKAMHASLSQSAQLTLNSSFDASKILEFRQRLKDILSDPRHAGVVVPYKFLFLFHPEQRLSVFHGAAAFC